jgi:hypothetical protein
MAESLARTGGQFAPKWRGQFDRNIQQAVLARKVSALWCKLVQIGGTLFVTIHS